MRFYEQNSPFKQMKFHLSNTQKIAVFIFNFFEDENFVK